MANAVSDVGGASVAAGARSRGLGVWIVARTVPTLLSTWMRFSMCIRKPHIDPHENLMRIENPHIDPHGNFHVD